MIKVAIIDSGIDLNHALFNNKNIRSFEFINESLHECIGDSYGHGTAIAGIIGKCNLELDISVIKMKDIENGLDESSIIAVLHHLEKTEYFDIINMSFGINICQRGSELFHICKKITDKGTIIISAFDNAGIIAYPAAFENVIGVISGHFCRKINDFEYIEGDPVVNLAAKGDIQRVAWTNPPYMMIGGNSFACAHVTVQTAKFIQEGAKTREEVLCRFKAISRQQYDSAKWNCENSLPAIQNAILFPFNKEMHSIVRYIGILPFHITDIYDTKYSFSVGATTTHLLKDEKVKKYKIKNIDQIDWDTFDTLILGHMEDLSSLIGENDLKYNLVSVVLQKEKNIYSFDELSKYEFHTNSRIYYPKIDRSNLPPNRYGMLYRISKPVVGVFGTSSRQGKFTLQLKLRELLLKQNYSVGQVGTEPSSLLYGMDYVFPMGYNSSVFIKEFDTIRYLNNIMNELCLRENDIILVGSQSGTVTYDTGNISQFNIPQYHFLLGTQPDAVILCVNPFDEMEYLQRTVAFIESSVNCKVIAFVVFPMDIKDNWMSIYGSKIILSDDKYQELRKQYTEQFNINVYRLGDKDGMNQLIDRITDYFAE